MITLTRRTAALASAAILAGGLALAGTTSAQAATPASHDPYGHVDSVVVGTKGAGIIGWAADPDNPKVPLTVHLTVDHKYTLKGKSGISRPDVQKARHTGPDQGFAAAAQLKPGKHTLCLGVLNIGPGHEVYYPCVTVTIK